MYNNTGGLGDKPLTISVIDKNGNRKVIATYQGGYYKKWLGPDPAKPDNFVLTTAVKDIKYIVLTAGTSSQPNWNYMVTTKLPLQQNHRLNRH